MTGKLLGIVILASALLGGAAMYYLQVFAFYERTAPQESLTLFAPEGEEAEVLEIANYQGIDADSSPIRYRACFDLAGDPAAVAGVPYEGAAPRNAPFWFSCFDAEEIGAEMAAGTARVLTVARNIEFGIDRVVALTADGRGYVWQEINECGKKAYDGTPLGEDCPKRN